MRTKIDSLLAGARVMRHEVSELRVSELCSLAREFAERGGVAGMAEAAMAFGEVG